MTLIFKKCILTCAIFSTIMLPLTISSCAFQNWQSRLIKNVLDGETYICSNNKTYNILGVDTPKISKNNSKTTGLQYFYALKAIDYVKKRILNKSVEFLDHTLTQSVITVSRIKINNADLSIELAKHGIARVAFISYDIRNQYYYSDFNFIKSLQLSQLFAMNNKLGFWKNTNSIKEIFPNQNVVIPN